MDDKELKCVDCGNLFIFTSRDQEFYAEKGFKDPKRCAECRVTKKAKFNDKKTSNFQEKDYDNTQGYSY